MGFHTVTLAVKLSAGQLFYKPHAGDSFHSLLLGGNENAPNTGPMHEQTEYISHRAQSVSSLEYDHSLPCRVSVTP